VRISKKLSVFFAGVIVAFSVLAVTLIMQLRTQARQYDALLNSPIHQMEEARVVQVDFKKQVQEWKDTLLRGHNSDDLANYTKKFHDMESQVHTEAEALQEQVTDPEARQLLEKFVNAHTTLRQKYAEAYKAYLEGNADFKAADRIMRGADRAPTDLFDAVVARLNTVTKESVAQQRQATSKGSKVAIATAGGLLFLVGFFGFLIVRDILARLGRLKQVSDRLAKADVSGLVVDMQGSDEIAEFGKSMRGVHAAIEELLIAASAQSKAQAAGKGQL